jgi:excisionase family DNA binding protein
MFQYVDSSLARSTSMIEDDGDVYLTADEACEKLGVKASTLYAYVSRRMLHSYRQGIRRQRLYRLGEVEALLQITRSEKARTLPLAKTWVEDH